MSDYANYAIATVDVQKRFGGIVAVDNVSIKVKNGERHGIIGPNGAGKTTLFQLIAGAYRCNHGQVYLFGEDVTNSSVIQRFHMGISRTYQISNVFLSLTIEENLMLAANPIKIPNIFRAWNKDRAIMEEIYHIAETVGLADKLGRKANELSYGEKRQLELGLAVASKPRIFMFDEPAAGLSPAERVQLVDLINDLAKDATLVIVEHDMDILFNVTDQITVLNQGSIIASGTPEEIKKDEDVKRVYMGEWS